MALCVCLPMQIHVAFCNIYRDIDIDIDINIDIDRYVYIYI